MRRSLEIQGDRRDRRGGGEGRRGVS